MEIELRRWSSTDLPLLERANTPEMTRFLGGPETAEKLIERHERYLRLAAAGEASMYVIEADRVGVGGIGFWQTDEDGVPAWETGWHVETEWQGRGIAREALRLLVRIVADDGTRDLLVAYPGAENAASNALCRWAGFELRGSMTEPWREGELTSNIWALDMSPLDLTGRRADVDERFEGGDLDRTRWSPFYLPHWASRAASEARHSMTETGLVLRIDHDTDPWAPEWDGETRVSHLQTGQFSGGLGTEVGQHRFRDGLVVREVQPEQRLWLVNGGVIEVRMAAIRHPDAMVAFWPIGFEDRPDDCGEICVAEIFGRDIDSSGGLVGVGVKAQHDPRLRTDFEQVRIDGDLTEPHDYAVEWTPERLRYFVDGRWVKTVGQSIRYPVQFMLDVFELPRDDGSRDTPALPHRFRVERVRTFAPR